jgi:hypothetical protein
MSLLHRDRAPQTFEPTDAAPHAGRPIQARGRRAIQRRGADIPRGAELQLFKSDSDALIASLGQTAGVLAGFVNAKPLELESWADALRAFLDGVMDGKQRHKKLDAEVKGDAAGGTQSTSTWHATIDLGIEDANVTSRGPAAVEDLRKSAQGVNDVKGHAEGNKAQGGFNYKVGMQDEIGAEIGAGGNAGAKVEGVGEVGANANAKIAGKTVRSHELGQNFGVESHADVNDSHAVNQADERAKLSKYNVEKQQTVARVVATVTLSLHHVQIGERDYKTFIHEGADYRDHGTRRATFDVDVGRLTYTTDGNILPK